MWFRRIRLVVAWLVGLYLAQMYVSMGLAKFDPNGFWTAPFERWGYPEWLRVGVGAVETLGGVGLLIPWVASYAGGAVAVVMVGAGFTRLLDGRLVDVAFIAAYIVALLWVAFEYRGFRFGGKGRATKAPEHQELIG
jgi:uncharacterized membrane protein YphA (DoxX/SURF4 family)